jgi:hypothetical protein
MGEVIQFHEFRDKKSQPKPYASPGQVELLPEHMQVIKKPDLHIISDFIVPPPKSEDSQENKPS